MFGGMKRLHVLCLPNASPLGIGAVKELCARADRYTEAVYRDAGGPSRATNLSFRSLDGKPVRLLDGSLQPTEGMFAPGDDVAGIFIPDIVAKSEDELETILLQVREATPSVLSALKHGAICAAAGAGVLMPLVWGLGRQENIVITDRLRMAFGDLDRGARLITHQPTSLSTQLITAADGAFQPSVVLEMLGRVFSGNLANMLAGETGIARLPTSIDPGQEPLQESGDPLVEQARAILRRQFATPPTIAQLATQLSVSQKTLTRRFRAATEMTPLQYLQAVRMAAARRQLRDTQRRVEHIAAMVGYQDITTFRDNFRREVGMTPTDFRKAARDGALPEQG